VDLYNRQKLQEKCLKRKKGKEKCGKRECRWTESIVVGSEGFVRELKEKFGPKAIWREMAAANRSKELREPVAAHEAVFDAQNGYLR
jgi:hypothetical protein